MSMLLFQFTPLLPSPAHNFVLYVCISFPALQTGSSASTFYDLTYNVAHPSPIIWEGHSTAQPQQSLTEGLVMAQDVPLPPGNFNSILIISTSFLCALCLLPIAAPTPRHP